MARAQSGTGGNLTVSSGITVLQASPIPSMLRAPGPVHPFLPLFTVNVTPPDTSGYTMLTAISAADYQAKINTAAAGCDNGGATGYLISIAPGSVFTANTFLLPASTCIVSKIITTTAGFSGVRGTRIDPSIAVGTIASLRSTAAGSAVLMCNANIPCGPYSFIGIELNCDAPTSTCFTTWAPNNNTDVPANLPHDLIFDHVYAHNHASRISTHCMLLNGNNIAIVDSWVSDCHSTGQDSQALTCFAGGPWRVENSFLEGAGENMICGGGNIGGVNVVYGLNPRDMTSQYNWYYKPQQWFAGSTTTVFEGITWSVKNSYETKQCVRCLLQYSVLEGNWFPSAQTGGILSQNPATSQGSFFAIASDSSFFYNHFIGGTHWIESIGVDANTGARTNVYRLEITNNLFEDVGANWGVAAPLVKPSYIQGMIVNHNTSTTTTQVTGTQVTDIFARTGPYYFANNITQHGSFGFNITNFAFDNIANLNVALGAMQAPFILSNALQGMPSSNLATWNADVSGHYAGNSNPATMNDIGFVNAAPAGGDYHLLPSSPYIAGGVHGCHVNADNTGGPANCGADIDTILAQTAHVRDVPSLWPDSLSGGGIKLNPAVVVCNGVNTVTINPVAGSKGGTTFTLNGLDILFNGTLIVPMQSIPSAITIVPPVHAAATVPITASNFGLPLTASLQCA